ncbi:DAK2 domain-containing protein [Porcipelethomonas ammoniilytica]|uniref:DAK2 domain-containing protein n=1 Tax=Porcipelethomonas ammoniilytica TaxID=2981722 RepID=UPI000820285E|nr:DAK2 domain-containing protein [Porcipelethomonas ammoniilytica]MCU6719243.1 DAK2 domain-containing protein [Porcipelethomonas ammoniilytica]SCI74408.1 dihydroxyacetone kinase [uncultured Ruminococcus sp.]
MLKGKLFRDSLISAGISIENNRRRVDELNVYPVPDGDTGTNMSMTMSAAARELELADDNITVSQAADIAASALLRGARGNSGVILSLLFRGFSKGFAGLETADCIHIAKAMEIGVEAAYKSVMNPTEGTVLTVARKAAERAGEIAEYSGSIQSFWNEICIAAQEALERTPEQLPVLKKAGVVDAGGQGLVIIYRAMLDVFSGNGIAKKSDKKPVARTFEVTDNSAENEEEIKYSYCTEYIIEKKTGCKDAFMLRAYLETIGDCVVVVEDDEIIKVHVHTDNPGLAIQKALEFGRFVNDPKPKIENMKIQHEMRVKDEKITNRQEFVPIRPEKDFGFVAVAAGHGLEEMFKDLGADCIIKGGQTMNPSTDDILKAIHATPARTVFVLPNNKNIIMAAEQAVNLADRNVCVLPTRTIPQGISALMAFDESNTFTDNRMEMIKAIERVSTGQVTFAARDSEYEGHNIKKGEIMAFNNGKLQFAEKDVNKAAYKLAKKMTKSDTSYITVIYGADVTEEQAESLIESLEAKLGSKIEIMLVNGGQPVYYYIISVEPAF